VKEFIAKTISFAKISTLDCALQFPNHSQSNVVMRVDAACKDFLVGFIFLGYMGSAHDRLIESAGGNLDLADSTPTASAPHRNASLAGASQCFEYGFRVVAWKRFAGFFDGYLVVHQVTPLRRRTTC
jgi:hypothetical protein